ncbi:MAG: PepSY-like domain-containing protein [Bernardetiaceae bacterium]|nr:PepSY-like domain-containing protein [Bernardetiaceae bacterium]
MKHLTCILLIAFLCTFQALQAQSIPADVKAAFEKKFKGATLVSHHLIKEYHNIIFQADETIKVAKFDKESNWVETKTSLYPTTMPEEIHNYLQGHYEGKHVFTTKVEIKGQPTSFLAYVTETLVARFDAYGNFIKEETIDPIDHEVLQQLLTVDEEY